MRDRALILFQEALALNQEIYGQDHPETGTLLNNLGMVHEDNGEIQLAEQLFLESLEIRKKVFGENHPSTV